MLEIAAYVPEESLPIIERQLKSIDVTIRVTKKRLTIHGDYQQTKGGGHRISVNGSLNRYAFLITLVHEIAHALCFEKHGRRVKPHGAEWKSIFANLMTPHIEGNVFPVDIEVELQRHMGNPKASSTSDHRLTKVLRKYDKKEAMPFLDDLNVGTKFIFRTSGPFIKGKKNRTRHVCKEIKSGKTYLISGIAEVQVLEE